VAGGHVGTALPVMSPYIEMAAGFAGQFFPSVINILCTNNTVESHPRHFSWENTSN